MVDSGWAGVMEETEAFVAKCNSLVKILIMLVAELLKEAREKPISNVPAPLRSLHYAALVPKVTWPSPMSMWKENSRSVQQPGFCVEGTVETMDISSNYPIMNWFYFSCTSLNNCSTLEHIFGTSHILVKLIIVYLLCVQQCSNCLPCIILP